VAALDGAELGVTVARRCVDLADLLAAAASGQARAVVLSADLRRLDRDALGRLAAAGVATVGMAASVDGEDAAKLRRLGVAHVLAPDADGPAVAAAVLAAVAGVDPPPEGVDPSLALARSPRGTGRVVAVWGPAGAPGRTTIAVGVADEAARHGVATLLADLDVYGGVVAQLLGMLDEAPGVAAAARLEANGQLDLARLAGTARALGPYLRVLTGLVRAERWPELRPDAVRGLLERCRLFAMLTVVDCGFSLEQDEELAYDTVAPRRNGATLAALGTADAVVAVGAADPVGLQRLIRGLSELREAAPAAATPQVVINKVRRGATPGNPEREIAAVLRRYAGVEDPTFLPYDLASLDRAVVAGRTLGEMAPQSPLRQAFTILAARLTGS
jgi:Flp pilus assembly CpaE family ATPase